MSLPKKRASPASPVSLGDAKRYLRDWYSDNSSERGLEMDLSLGSSEPLSFDEYSRWAAAPNRYDLQGVDTPLPRAKAQGAQGQGARGQGAKAKSPQAKRTQAAKAAPRAKAKREQAAKGAKRARATAKAKVMQVEAPPPLSSAQELAEQLEANGFVVVCNPWFVENLAQMQAGFMEALRGMPEFLRSPENPDRTPNGEPLKYVAGGFAALGNPASFHNDYVRLLRQWCMHALLPVLGALARNQGLERLEQVVDRMMFRPAGAKASAESWHRDEAPLALDGDLTLGGWLNLDNRAQYLSCVPGTHLLPQGRGGFATISKEDAARENYAERKRLVVVPPGCILVFWEHIVHEVRAVPLKYDSKRLFLGWRLTNSEEPLFANIDQRLRGLEVMPLKSNQEPPMWPKLYWVNYRGALERWSKATFPDVCLAVTRVQTGKDKGQEVTHVHQNMQPLGNYGFDTNLYNAYATYERNLYKPHKSFTLLPPGKVDASERVELTL